MAKLYFRYGAMNSGKTTHLLQVAHNYKEQGMDVLIAKPSLDTKGEDKLISRLGISRQVDVLFSKDENLKDVLKDDISKRDIKCILVDEAQFLSEKQVDELLKITSENNIPVIAYGLRTDYRREAFSGSARLLLVAHSLEELKTICSCGKKAIFNIRNINGKPVFSGEQVSIDNQDNVTYNSVCNDCYNKLVKP